MRGLGFLILLLLLAACNAEAPFHTLRPAPLEEALRNPERGFYRTGLNLFDPANEAAIAELTASGVTLVYPHDTWLPPDRELSANELEALEASFERLATHGLKLILRFRYSEEGDAPLDVIETHLGQLLPVVRENADLVYVFQAGFLGRWGEWHCWQATEVCHDDDRTKAWLLDRLLEGLPEDLPIAVRYPGDKARYLEARAELAPKARLRIVHHNDCWLADATDMGTYPEEDPETWRAFVYAENDRLVYGGETCARNPPRTDGENALSEAERAHLDYLNAGYHNGLIEEWKQDGTFARLAARLGYRLELTYAAWPEEAKMGAPFLLTLRIKNTGFSRLKRPRLAYLVLEGAGGRLKLPLAALDLRAIGPDETREFTLIPRAPTEPGTYRLGLWFPDASKRLGDNPLFAVRLASELTFEDGVNWLGALSVR